MLLIGWLPAARATDYPVFPPSGVNRTLSDTTYLQEGICTDQLPYVWNGVTFTQAGTQSVTLTASDGSDSLVVMTLLVGEPVYLTVYGSGCQGYSYTEHGFNLPPDSLASGTELTFVRTSPTPTGCDSIITLNLSLTPLPTIVSSGDVILDPGQSVTLSSTGADYYVWTPAAYLSNTTSSQTVCSPDQSMYVFVSGYNTGINLIGNGDFEQGSAGFTSSYTLNTNLWGEATYYVGSNANNYHSNFQGSHDHTTGSGNYMIINGATSPGTVVWSQTIPVTPGTDYAFSTWVTSVCMSPWAELQFSINGQQLGNVFTAPSQYGQVNTWELFYIIWNSGNNTQATISIINQNTAGGGNDFGLDDISFFKLTNCGVTDTIQVLVRHFEDTAICSYDLPFSWYGVNFTESDSLEHIVVNPYGVDDCVVMNVEIVESMNPDLGEDIFLCYGDMAELSLDSVPPDVAIHWNTGDTTSSIFVLVDGYYDVSVIGTSANGLYQCYGRDTVRVTSVDQPHIDFESGTTQGCIPLSVHITNHSTPDTASYEWYLYDANGQLAYASIEADPTFDFQEPGIFSLFLRETTPYGCVDSLYVPDFIEASFQPTADFSADPEISMMADAGGEVHFINYSDSSYLQDAHVVWDFGDGVVDDTEFSPTHTYTQWGDYIVTLSILTDAGCNSEIAHQVIIEQDLVFPNVITPNGDGINDVFAIGNLNTNINPEDPDEYRHNDLYIYDRWGRKVYQAHNYDTFARNGQIEMGQQVFDASNLSDGVYYFSFYYKGMVKTVNYHGSLTVVR
ncbi:MAG: gliding motility-associated C-terminal domain-containing protein [Bacteroidales bacterium]|nr:gliding motility-associated C-terminal domain-containing protein [Bacteroidales bacterium]